MSKDSYDIAAEVKTKFEFYLIALVFTVLALSIQTGEFTSNYSQYIFEYSAWAAFVISGLAGLSRLEWISVLYLHNHFAKEEKVIISGLEEGEQGKRDIINEKGEPYSLDEIRKKLAHQRSRHGLRKKIQEKRERYGIIKYGIHKWGFVLGIILLIFSRGLYHYDESIACCNPSETPPSKVTTTLEEEKNKQPVPTLTPKVQQDTGANTEQLKQPGAAHF